MCCYCYYCRYLNIYSLVYLFCWLPFQNVALKLHLFFSFISLLENFFLFKSRNGSEGRMFYFLASTFLSFYSIKWFLDIVLKKYLVTFRRLLCLKSFLMFRSFFAVIIHYCGHIFIFFCCRLLASCPSFISDVGGTSIAGWAAVSSTN